MLLQKQIVFAEIAFNLLILFSNLQQNSEKVAKLCFGNKLISCCIIMNGEKSVGKKMANVQ